MRPPAPALARGFKKKVVEAAPAKKKTSGSDPYGALKRAILSEPDPEALQKVHTETREEAALRNKLTSRQLMRENMRANGALSRLIKLRESAIVALPEALQEEARSPDLTLFPLQRRVFTETAPIPNFQQKLRRTDRG